MTEWQPIETYEDGKVLFLYRDGCMCLGDRDALYGPSEWRPTHWIALPPMPYEPEEWRTTAARKKAAL